MSNINVKQVQVWLWLGFITILIVGATACTVTEETIASAPSPVLTPVTIVADGETIILLAGENISPENYALAQDADFSAQVDWVLINGLWEPLAPGVEALIDICQVNPIHPDCGGMLSPTPTALTGVPEEWQTWADPAGRFSFDFPAGWHTLSVTPDPADGVQVMDASSLDEATWWISLNIFANPEQASLSIWLAERQGQVWVGQVAEEQEDIINGVPVLRQRLENIAPTIGDPYVYALMWQPVGEYVLLWTAWPGEEPETLNLLERMVSGFKSNE